MKTPEIISLDSQAFEKLLETVADFLKDRYGSPHEEWIKEADAKKLLNLSSPTSMARLRSEGLIKYSQPQKKVILYSRSSIYDYLETHSKKTF